MRRTSLMVANWKMYKTIPAARAFALELVRRLEATPPSEALVQVLCPTALALAAVAERLRGSAIRVGAQNLDLGSEGPKTGALSAYLLRDAGAEYVIVGHSERRQEFGEDDELIARKTAAALAGGLTPIVCVGETRQERDGGLTAARVSEQVRQVLAQVTAGSDLVVAYEPVWAIGSGHTPTASEAEEVARLIRELVEEAWPGRGAAVQVLYGGSVNRDTIRTFAEHTSFDGVLVGGASLDVGHWLDIIQRWGEVRC
ncbi:MAG: triose-phosphate isomerase [Firmicutes bacterium]|nr:triose-phosphate isomerase [Bacillota bacterium]